MAPRAFTLINPEDGTVVKELELPEDLTSPVTIGDIDNDGINDFLFTSSAAVHAYVVVRRPSSLLFQLLIGCLIAVIIGVMIVGIVDSKGMRKAQKD